MSMHRLLLCGLCALLGSITTEAGAQTPFGGTSRGTPRIVRVRPLRAPAPRSLGVTPYKDPRASAYRGFQNQDRATAYRGFQNRDRQTAYRGFQNQDRATAYRGFQNQGRATQYRRNGRTTYVVLPNRRPSTSGTFDPGRRVTTGHWSNQRIPLRDAKNRFNRPLRLSGRRP